MKHKQRLVAAAHLEDLAEDNVLSIQVWRGAHRDEESAQHMPSTLASEMELSHCQSRRA
jgi:hypothetical protein